jgi:hypothetical protein
MTEFPEGEYLASLNKIMDECNSEIRPDYYIQQTTNI